MAWQHRQAGSMHHEAYQTIGGVYGAIAQRANEIYERLVPVEQQAAHRMLIRLIRTGEGTKDTRQRVALDDLDVAVLPVVQQMVAGRLLVTGRDPALNTQTLQDNACVYAASRNFICLRATC